MRKLSIKAMKMKEDNAKLALFSGRQFGMSCASDYKDVPLLKWPPMKFHLSWSWIMPVAQKVVNCYHDNRQHVFQALQECDIKKLFPALVEFVDWYNAGEGWHVVNDYPKPDNFRTTAQEISTAAEWVYKLPPQEQIKKIEEFLPYSSRTQNDRINNSLMSVYDFQGLFLTPGQVFDLYNHYNK